MSEPREWVLSDHFDEIDVVGPLLKEAGSVRVVEKPAYDTLLAENQVLNTKVKTLLTLASIKERHDYEKCPRCVQEYRILEIENQKLKLALIIAESAITSADNNFGLVGGMTSCQSTRSHINNDGGVVDIIREALTKIRELTGSSGEGV